MEAIIANTFLIIILAILTSITVAAGNDQPPVALPGCKDSCNNITVPYPFGLGDGCSHNIWFNLTCRNRFSYDPTLVTYNSKLSWSTLMIQRDPFKPSAKRDGHEIAQLTMKGSTTTPTNSISITDSWDQFRVSGNDLYAMKKLDLRGTPFRLMGTSNVLLVGGCTGSAVLIRNARNETLAGCATVCQDSTAETNKMIGSCYGLGCCQSVIPNSLDYIEMDFLNLIQRNINVSRSDPRATAAVVDLSYLANRTIDQELSEFVGAPTLLQWRIEDLPIDSPSYANSSCVKESDGGYSCRCKQDYYEGNPYLPNGCRAIKECRDCPNDCVSAGNNAFRCPPPPPPPPPPSPPPPPPPRSSVVSSKLVLGLGVSLTTVFMFIMIFGFYKLLTRRKEIKFKEENFKKNGGLLLQQQMRSGDGSIERTKIFSRSELEKATDSFNLNRVLGHGGQGTVYKGMLVDGTIVAIKKSKKVSETQLGQFINEVVILSQVNHKNVVKLFGCCLETEVPLLVYEYVPNGTLYQHIHSPYEDFHITWAMRMQIATESAEALSYLHSSSSLPIYHRDVKTSNILLDDRYRAKVSDFGTSKTLSIDQTHVSTCVQGTFGYLDPEFMQSNQFTEKSDVYSFGIVLLELLTSKKPFYEEKPEERKGLALEFLTAMESSRLYDIVDPQVYGEAGEQEIEGVADLARRCLNLSGRQRPTMKEVAMTLHMICSQNREPNTFRQDFVPIDEMSMNQVFTSDEGSLSHSSTFGQR